MHRSLPEKSAVVLPLFRFWESLVFRDKKKKKTTEFETINAAKPKLADLMHEHESFDVFNYVCSSITHEKKTIN